MNREYARVDPNGGDGRSAGELGQIQIGGSLDRVVNAMNESRLQYSSFCRVADGYQPNGPVVVRVLAHVRQQANHRSRAQVDGEQSGGEGQPAADFRPVAASAHDEQRVLWAETLDQMCGQRAIRTDPYLGQRREMNRLP